VARDRTALRIETMENTADANEVPRHAARFSFFPLLFRGRAFRLVSRNLYLQEMT
jgi:hypothetical protein